MMSVIQKLPKPFIDDRGEIQNLLSEHHGSCVVIKSVKGCQRANHYHKKDYHYCYLISGEIIYLERAVGKTVKPEEYIIKPGTMFFTGPMIEHSMYFTENSIFITFGGGTRLHKDYESDLVRIPSLYDVVYKYDHN